MRAVVFSQSFVARLEGNERHFVGTTDTAFLSPHEVYVDTDQGVPLLLQSAQAARIECQEVNLAERPPRDMPLRLNGAPGQPTWLPRDEALIASLRARLQPGQALRIAVFNAFGTALGDNVLGAQAFRVLYPLLLAVHPLLEVDIVRSWATAKPAYVLADEPWVNAVKVTPMTLHDWQGYHGFFDFSGFSGLAGFLDVPWPDFHLQHLGIDPALVPAEFKRASHPLRRPEDYRRGVIAVQEQAPAERGPRVFVHATASNHLRSMPRPALHSLIAGLGQGGYQLVTDDREVVLVAHGLGMPLVWVRDRSMDELRGALAAADHIITCDSFLLHVANLSNRPVTALCVAHQRYPNGMLPWQDNITVLEVDQEQRFPGKFKMAEEEIAEAGLTDYFLQAWQQAALKALKHLRASL